MSSESRTGLFLLDKPPGPSSFGAIAQMRPLLGRRVGHAGTLDPFATGLLLVLAGRATRLAPFLSGLTKRYEAVVQFGATTTTDDPEGQRTETGLRTTPDAVAAALPSFAGAIRQRPPAASAIHIDGERAYRRMRRGEEVIVPERSVTVHEIRLTAFDEEAQTASLDILCSTGTYVRAIARDLGAAVGSGGYCSRLRRTAIGHFDVSDAQTPDDARTHGIAAAAWREPAIAVSHLPQRQLTSDEMVAVGYGRSVDLQGADAPAVSCVYSGRLIAIASPREGALRPVFVVEAA